MIYPVKITSTQSDNVLEVRWDPSNTCNFSCKYCFPNANANTHRTTENIDLLVNNFRHLFDHYNKQLKKDKFHFIIGGGEPTLWKNFGVFLNEIKMKHAVYTSVISNGSRTLRWWQEYAPYIDNAILSCHVAQADLDHHIAVADTLYKQGKKVTVLVLMDPGCWEDCVAAIDYMKQHSKYPWFIETKTIVDTALMKITYTQKQQDFLKTEIKRMPNIVWFIKNIKLLINGAVKRYKSVAVLNTGKKLFAKSSTYINMGFMNFKGWDCSIGLESVYIEWDGTIKGSCGQHLYALPVTFNILDQDFAEQFNINLVSSICQSTVCSCLPETHVSKFNFSQRDIGRTRTIIPITDDRVGRNNKVSFIDIT
jgi:organic radical activating enzyme